MRNHKEFPRASSPEGDPVISRSDAVASLGGKVNSPHSTSQSASLVHPAALVPAERPKEHPADISPNHRSDASNQTLLIEPSHSFRELWALSFGIRHRTGERYLGVAQHIAATPDRLDVAVAAGVRDNAAISLNGTMITNLKVKVLDGDEVVIIINIPGG